MARFALLVFTLCHFALNYTLHQAFAAEGDTAGVETSTMQNTCRSALYTQLFTNFQHMGAVNYMLESGRWGSAAQYAPQYSNVYTDVSGLGEGDFIWIPMQGYDHTEAPTAEYRVQLKAFVERGGTLLLLNEFGPNYFLGDWLNQFNADMLGGPYLQQNLSEEYVESASRVPGGLPSWIWGYSTTGLPTQEFAATAGYTITGDVKPLYLSAEGRVLAAEAKVGKGVVRWVGDTTFMGSYNPTIWTRLLGCGTPKPEISWIKESLEVKEGEVVTAWVWLYRTQELSSTVSLRLTIAGSALEKGTATLPDGLTAGQQTITFQPGEDLKQWPVTIVNDTFDNGGTEVRFQVTGDGAIFLAGTGTSTITIVDDDAPGAKPCDPEGHGFQSCSAYHYGLPLVMK